MRTTVTLDPDVVRLLRDAMHRSRATFKDTLNAGLRAGLTARRAPTDPEPRFEVRARSLGLRTGIDAGRLNQLADELESEAVARSRSARRRP